MTYYSNSEALIQEIHELLKCLFLGPEVNWSPVVLTGSLILLSTSCAQDASECGLDPSDEVSVL